MIVQPVRITIEGITENIGDPIEIPGSKATKEEREEFRDKAPIIMAHDYYRIAGRMHVLTAVKFSSKSDYSFMFERIHQYPGGPL